MAHPLSPTTLALTYGATFVAITFYKEREMVSQIITKAMTLAESTNLILFEDKIPTFDDNIQQIRDSLNQYPTHSLRYGCISCSFPATTSKSTFIVLSSPIFTTSSGVSTPLCSGICAQSAKASLRSVLEDTT